MDTKATIKVGTFSRGGKSRQNVTALDHDFKAKTTLTAFGIFLPAYAETFIDFTQSKVTADFMVDALERLWPTLKSRFEPHTLVINLDNGPENSSRRTQFIKRMVEFAHKHNVTIRLAYYPPYHSKPVVSAAEPYNPVERVWGILENHWNGELLDEIDKILGLARTMTVSVQGVNQSRQLDRNGRTCKLCSYGNRTTSQNHNRRLGENPINRARVYSQTGSGITRRTRTAGTKLAEFFLSPIK